MSDHTGHSVDVICETVKMSKRSEAKGKASCFIVEVANEVTESRINAIEPSKNQRPPLPPWRIDQRRIWPEEEKRHASRHEQQEEQQPSDEDSWTAAENEEEDIWPE